MSAVLPSADSAQVAWFLAPQDAVNVAGSAAVRIEKEKTSVPQNE
jgi:hypothetical protein